VPVINRAPRPGRARAELTRTVAQLLAPSLGAQVDELAPPVFVAESRRLDVLLRDGAGVPPALVGAVTGATLATIERASAAPVIDLTEPDPVPVRAGSPLVGRPDDDR
jgi:hypothetical protein